MSKTPFYKTGLGVRQGQTNDGKLIYSSIGPAIPDPEKEKLKLTKEGEKTYTGEQTTNVVEEKVKGGKNITTTTLNPWKATDEYEEEKLSFQQFEEQGGNIDEAKEWIKNNPEKYKKLLEEKNQTKLRTGVDETSKTKFVADPVNEPLIPPTPPQRKVQGYGYRSQGLGTLSSGQATTQAGAMFHALEKGQKGKVDIDKIYDLKAYGPGAMARLIQSNASESKKALGNWKTNPNYGQDRENWKKQQDQIRKDAVAWRKAGSSRENIPESIKAIVERMDNSWESVTRWNNNNTPTYMMTRGQPVKS